MVHFILVIRFSKHFLIIIIAYLFKGSFLISKSVSLIKKLDENSYISFSEGSNQFTIVMQLLPYKPL